VLGDSSAAGVGVQTQAQALVGQTVGALAGRYRVSWELVAATGMTTRGMIMQLERRPADRYDIALTALGVNDVTRRRPVTTWLAEQRNLWDILRTRFGTSRIIVSGLPPVHVFPALPQPLRWYLGAHAKRLDRALRRIVAGEPDCHFVDLHQLKDRSAMAADGFHPGADAYTWWGRTVAAAIDHGMRYARDDL
jgi:lysophospholipase L1-like esterase